MRLINTNLKKYNQLIRIYLLSLNLIVLILRESMLLKKIFFILDPINKYTHWLIFRFMPIAKKAKFTLEQLAKIIFRNNKLMLIKQFDEFFNMLNG